MKQRIQIGAEGFDKDGKSVFRLTPFDIGAEAKPEIVLYTGIVENMIDMRDIQPGDGEIDFPVGKDAIRKMLPMIPKDKLDIAHKINMFVNFK